MTSHASAHLALVDLNSNGRSRKAATKCSSRMPEPKDDAVRATAKSDSASASASSAGPTDREDVANEENWTAKTEVDDSEDDQVSSRDL